MAYNYRYSLISITDMKIEGMKIFSSNLYGLLSLFVALILILFFFAIFVNVLNTLVTFRADICSLNESWLFIRARTAEILFSHDRKADVREIGGMISEFDHDLRDIFSLAPVLATGKIQIEIEANLDRIKSEWDGIHHTLTKILASMNTGTLSTGNSKEFTIPELSQLTPEIIREIHWISTDTTAFAQELTKIINWADNYGNRQIRAFRVLFYCFGGTILLAIIGLVGIGVDISRKKDSQEKSRFLTQSLLKAQESERKKIALELHDSVAQDLSSVKMALEGLPEETGKIPELIDLLDGSIEAVRDLSYSLHPSNLHHFGLVHTLSQFCREFSARNGLKVQFSSAGMDDLTLDFNTEINLYRIVQEALNNTRRHSKANKAAVKLVASHPIIMLRIEDNGVGFNRTALLREPIADKRMGIAGMAERARLLDGKMKFQSKINEGTRILVEIPFSTNEGKHESEEKSTDS